MFRYLRTIEFNFNFEIEKVAIQIKLRNKAYKIARSKAIMQSLPNYTWLFTTSQPS